MTKIEDYRLSFLLTQTKLWKFKMLAKKQGDTRLG